MKPCEAPVPLLVVALVAGMLLVALGGWLLLPDSPLTVALVGLLLGAPFYGLARILELRQFSRPPERRPHAAAQLGVGRGGPLT